MLHLCLLDHSDWGHSSLALLVRIAFKIEAFYGDQCRPMLHYSCCDLQLLATCIQSCTIALNRPDRVQKADLLRKEPDKDTATRPGC